MRPLTAAEVLHNIELSKANADRLQEAFADQMTRIIDRTVVRAILAGDAMKKMSKAQRVLWEFGCCPRCSGVMPDDWGWDEGMPHCGCRGKV